MRIRFTSLAVALVLLATNVSLAAEVLPGTKPWALDGDPASLMVDGIDRFLLRQIEQARDRAKPSSTRERLAQIIECAGQTPALP